MELVMYKNYKGKNIYKNVNDGCFIVYEDEGNKIVKEAIRLFVQNDIDVNMPIFAYNSSECLVKNDIDVDLIVSKSECKFGMNCFLESEKY